MTKVTKIYCLLLGLNPWELETNQKVLKIQNTAVISAKWPTLNLVKETAVWR